VKGTTK